MKAKKTARKKHKTKVFANPSGGVTISIEFTSKRMRDAFAKALSEPVRESGEVES